MKSSCSLLLATLATILLLTSLAWAQSEDAPGSENEPPPPAPVGLPSLSTRPAPPLPEALRRPAPAGPTEEFVGHRLKVGKESGWGWVKRPKENWRTARWVVLRETPGEVVAPWRALGNATADQNTQYKLWGYFADHRVYDPVTDEMNVVFVLERFEIIGPAAPLDRKPGPEERFVKGRASRASSREDRPMPDRE